MDCGAWLFDDSQDICRIYTVEYNAQPSPMVERGNANRGDLGRCFVDLNGDGYIDYVTHHKLNNSIKNEAWISKNKLLFRRNKII